MHLRGAKRARARPHWAETPIGCALRIAVRSQSRRHRPARGETAGYRHRPHRSALEPPRERYLNRAACEFNGYAGPIWRDAGFLGCEVAYRSERDDWILAMIASGLGFRFMPASCATHPAVVSRPMMDPEFWLTRAPALARGRGARARGDAHAMDGKAGARREGRERTARAARRGGRARERLSGVPHGRTLAGRLGRCRLGFGIGAGETRAELLAYIRTR